MCFAAVQCYSVVSASQALAHSALSYNFQKVDF